ncbi:LysR family transcriptional regulator [Robbsia andropogonis]|uniref:LysR family transcriptional regulator n=1 Tax=Robbsia andropogonis TaxID=28092 RepID=UPI003D1B086C
MELHQLEAFSAVMSVGSITGAGKLLARSQPAVTRQIQELEADLGYALFARNGPRVTPTHEAFLLYEEVERSLVGLEAITQRARAIGNGTERPIALAATSALGTSIVPEALRRVLEDEARGSDGGAACGRVTPANAIAMPRWQVRTQSAEHIVHAVLTDHADIGLTTLPVAHDGLDVHWIAEAPCVLALPPGHPLAVVADPEREENGLWDLPPVPLRALHGVGLATVANRHRLRHRIDAAFARAHVTPAIWLESNSGANALMAARTGAMAAVVDPATAIGHQGNGVHIRALTESIPFLFAVVTRAGRTQSPSVQRLLQALHDSARGLLRHVTFHAADAHDALLQQDRSVSTRGKAPIRTTLRRGADTRQQISNDGVSIARRAAKSTGRQ